MQGRYRVMLGLVLIVVFADQYTKDWATRYLRLPSAPCTQEHRACLLLCHASGSKATSQASLSPCLASCETNLRACRDQEEKEIDRQQIRIASLRGSLFCREIRQGWGGLKPVCVVIPEIFHLQYEINPGTALGMFGDLPSWFRRIMFVVVTTFALGFILFLFAFRITERHRLMIWGLSSVMAGAIGNFLDRLRFNYVVDFLDIFLPLGQGRVYHIPTFNIADVAISVGVGLILLDAFFPEPTAPPETPPAEPPRLTQPTDEASPAEPPRLTQPTDEASLAEPPPH